MELLTTFFAIWVLVVPIESAKILVIPLPFHSHMLSTNAIAQEMKIRGHEVYTVAEDFYKGKSSRIRASGLNVLYYSVPKGTIYPDSEELQQRLMTHILTEIPDSRITDGIMAHSCRSMHADEEFLNQVQSIGFDLALVEANPLLPCAYLLPHVFKIPYLTVLPWYFVSLPGSPALPSFQVGMFPAPSGDPFSFVERLKRLVIFTATSRYVMPTLGKLTGFVKDLSNTELIAQYKQRGMVSEEINAWYDLMDETQFYILVNNDVTIDYPKPLYPNMISVEGLTIDETKPLSEDMESLVSSADHGVIVVSFGSILNNLPKELFLKLIRAFGRRPELFLMRYPGTNISDVDVPIPANVKLLTWLPQADLLADNRTKLFITHGGTNGLHESIYHGVPMLCVPLFGDQPSNAYQIQARGYGLSFRLGDFTEYEIVEKISTIVENSTFKEITKLTGEILRDKPMNGRQTAAFWIEHVLKFGGEHLKPPSVRLTWWQYFCLDTLGTIAVFVVVVFVLILKISNGIVLLILRQAYKLKVE